MCIGPQIGEATEDGESTEGYVAPVPTDRVRALGAFPSGSTKEPPSPREIRTPGKRSRGSSRAGSYGNAPPQGCACWTKGKSTLNPIFPRIPSVPMCSKPSIHRPSNSLDLKLDDGTFTQRRDQRGPRTFDFGEPSGAKEYCPPRMDAAREHQMALEEQ